MFAAGAAAADGQHGLVGDAQIPDLFSCYLGLEEIMGLDQKVNFWC